MCKSDQIGDFKIINLVVDSQENNLHHQMGILNSGQRGKSTVAAREKEIELNFPFQKLLAPAGMVSAP